MRRHQSIVGQISFVRVNYVKCKGEQLRCGGVVGGVGGGEATYPQVTVVVVIFLFQVVVVGLVCI